MNPWWLGLLAAQATVACGDDTHRLRWEHGALQALDHDDPEAELALSALGGERCACADVLDAWARHDSDPRVLVLASRGPSDPLAAHADWTAQLGASQRAVTPTMAPRSRIAPRSLLRLPSRRRAMAASGASARASVGSRPVAAGQFALRTPAESELVALLGLGGGLQDRLVATVAAEWAQRFEGPESALEGARPQLYASMQGRLVAALRTWLGRTDLEVELEMIDGRSPPALSERRGAVRAELPFGWLADVWSRGLSIVWGRFCLAATTEDGRAWTLTTVGPDFDELAPVRVELPDTG
jgi:hypothetical protein